MKNIADLIIKFQDEKVAHFQLASERWRDGVIKCPRCKHEEAYVFSDGIRYKCTKCRYIFTAKTGTFMEGSKLKTWKWLVAMYLLLHKKGISSVQLGKDLGVTQKTAWFMMHRIRTAFNNTGKIKMTGEVEIDETFYGGRNKNRHYSKKQKYSKETGRNWKDKKAIFGMYERNTGTVRAQLLQYKDFFNVAATVMKNVQKGSTLYTDDWGGYHRLEMGYKRKSIDHSKGKYVDGEVTTNRMENFWSHFKRGMSGTYICVSTKHLNKYVQEFVFRFNNRNLDTECQIKNIIRQMECRLKFKDLKAA